MNILEEIQNCPVEWKELGEVTDTVTSPVKLTKKEYQVSGKIPIVDQGEQFIAGFSDYGKYLKKDEYIIFGDHSEHVKYIDFAFVQGADGLKILKPKSGIKAKYIYYCFCNFYKKEGSYKRHWSKARTTLIPIPQSEEIQEKIVQTLDKFTDYVTELTSELTSRKKQYSFYRDKLLSFEDEVYQVDWKTLGEVATVTKLAGYEFTKYVNYSSTGEIIALRALNVKKGRLVLDDVKYIDNSEFSKLNRSKLQIDDMLFTYVGTVGEVALIDKDDTYYLAPNVAMVRLNTNTIIAKYLMYYCQSNGFVYNQIERLMEASSMKNLTMEKIRKFKIPVPSLEIQSRIVQVLDNFDKVCNDLNIGLPKEIELRQKQYEYFREKLLTFLAEGEYTDSTVQYSTDKTSLGS